MNYNKEKYINDIEEKFYEILDNDDINFIDCIAPNENAHTRILIKLLYSNNNYLKSFLNYFGLPKLNIQNCIVEYNKDYIDGLIKDSKTAIIIENKVKWATDQNRQLERYVGEIFCNNDRFLIELENKETEKIINKLKFNDKQKEKLNNLIEESNKQKELLCIIEQLKENFENEIAEILEEQKEEYIESLTNILATQKPSKILIKRQNIYVLYLVPDDIKDPSCYSYTTLTKLFLDDNNDKTDTRFIKITYKQIVDWMTSLLELATTKQNLHNSICLYKNHINNYTGQEKEKYKIIEEVFKYDYTKLKKCIDVFESEIEKSKIENKNIKIKREIVNSINNYILKKLNNVFCLIEKVVEKDYEKIKSQKQYYFRFITKEIKNILGQAKKSFKDWDKILGFEFKVSKEHLVLSFCVISKNNWDDNNINENMCLINNIVNKFKNNQKYNSIIKYFKNDFNGWIIEECCKINILELILKKDSEIIQIIKEQFLENSKFKQLVECLTNK